MGRGEGREESEGADPDPDPDPDPPGEARVLSGPSIVISISPSWPASPSLSSVSCASPTSLVPPLGAFDSRFAASCLPLPLPPPRCSPCADGGADEEDATPSSTSTSIPTVAHAGKPNAGPNPSALGFPAPSPSPSPVAPRLVGPVYDARGGATLDAGVVYARWRVFLPTSVAASAFALIRFELIFTLALAGLARMLLLCPAGLAGLAGDSGDAATPPSRPGSLSTFSFVFVFSFVFFPPLPSPLPPPSFPPPSLPPDPPPPPPALPRPPPPPSRIRIPLAFAGRKRQSGYFLRCSACACAARASHTARSPGSRLRQSWPASFESVWFCAVGPVG